MKEECSEIFYPNRGIKNIISIFEGIFIFLCGLLLVRGISNELVSSLFGIVFLDLGVLFILLKVRFHILAGVSSIWITLILITCIAVFGIVFSSEFVFADYLAGESMHISSHKEHDWMYKQLSIIADRITEGQKIGEITKGLRLEQYKYLFSYSSLVFVFGGNSVTHICLWNSAHLVVFAILVTLCAYTYGIREKTHLEGIFIIAMLQPAFMTVFIYDRDIVGEVAVALALYIFLMIYDNSVATLLLFPLYGFLFYVFRFQYLLIAGFLCIWAVLRKRKLTLGTFLVAVIYVGVFIISVVRGGLLKLLWTELNLEEYISKAEFTAVSILSNIIRGLVGYFPWTNLFTDQYWWYHSFLCLQAVTSLSLWIELLVFEWKDFKVSLFKNPTTIFAVCSCAFAFISSGHIKYFAVASPFIALSFSGYDKKRRRVIWCLVFFVILFGSILYYLLGLTGSGLLKTSGAG